jgi:VWFA-related protein
MRRAAVVIVAAMIAPGLAVALAKADPQDAQRPVFRAGVDLVRVDAGVRSGVRIVTGLTAADFEVFDNGVAQQIEDVSYGRLPIDVTIALDVSQSVSGALLGRLRQGTLDLMRELKDDDRLRLLVFNARTTRLVDFTNDVRVVERALREIVARGSTALSDALSVALISAPRTERRQLVVFFTDGADVTSLTEQATLREVAQRSEATLVMVMPGGYLPVSGVTAGVSPASVVMGRVSVPVRGPAFYHQLTSDTGGSVLPVSPTVNLTSTFSRILGDFRSQYVLHYVPRGVERAGYHTLSVRVKKPNMQITARRGYFGS